MSDWGMQKAALRGAPGGRPAARRRARSCRSRACRSISWRRCSGPATGSAWRATTRSRPTSSPRRSPASTRRDVHDLHMVQSGVVLPEHLDMFEKGIARRLDFSYSGPQAARIAKMLFGGKIELGAVHTYLELFARYFIDLTPNVALIAAVSADRDGNLYTGPEHRGHADRRRGDRASRTASSWRRSTRSSTRCRASTSPATGCISWSRPASRSTSSRCSPAIPAPITETQILTAMLAIKGIYAPYGVRRLNHGIGFNTAAIELLLPTYGERLGLKGKICTHWALNPHPTLIPAIEAGWVEQIHCFGSEVGMEDYIARAARHLLHRARRLAALEPRLLPDGRPLCLRHVHRIDAADRPRGPQLDGHDQPHRRLRRRAQHGLRPARPPPSERALAEGRRGGRPRLRPRRCAAAASSWCRSARPSATQRCRSSSSGSMRSSWREKLDLDLAPVMVYADDVTHIVTEEGIANLLLCRDARTSASRRSAASPATPRSAAARDRDDGRAAARARRHPAPGGSRHRSARRRPPPARGPLDQGSHAGLRRPLPAAQPLPQLVRSFAWKSSASD